MENGIYYYHRYVGVVMKRIASQVKFLPLKGNEKSIKICIDLYNFKNLFVTEKGEDTRGVNNKLKHLNCHSNV